MAIIVTKVMSSCIKPLARDMSGNYGISLFLKHQGIQFSTISLPENPYRTTPTHPVTLLLAKFHRDISQVKMLISINSQSKNVEIEPNFGLPKQPWRGPGNTCKPGKFNTWPDITTLCLALLQNDKLYFGLLQCSAIVKQIGKVSLLCDG